MFTMTMAFLKSTGSWIAAWHRRFWNEVREHKIPSVGVAMGVLLLCFWRPIHKILTPMLHAHSRAAWLDIGLGTVLLAAIPFFLAAFGGHIAAEAIPDQSMQMLRR